MGLNSCYVILKYLVILINLKFWGVSIHFVHGSFNYSETEGFTHRSFFSDSLTITGLALLALSIWLLTDPSAYISVTQDEASFRSGIYVLLAIGILILIVGILGCCGACYENQCLLISFFCVLLVVVAAEIAAGAWAYTNREELKNLVKVSFQKTVEEEYGISKSRTITVDTIQQEVSAHILFSPLQTKLHKSVSEQHNISSLNTLKHELLLSQKQKLQSLIQQLQCCGANGPNDWANSQFNNKKDKLDLSVSSILQNFEIPASCCKGDQDDVLCKTGRIAQGTLPISAIIYQEGCVASVYRYLESYAPVIIGVIIAIILLEILGLILSLILCCAVRFVDRYKA